MEANILAAFILTLNSLKRKTCQLLYILENKTDDHPIYWVIVRLVKRLLRQPLDISLFWHRVLRRPIITQGDFNICRGRRIVVADNL